MKYRTGAEVNLRDCVFDFFSVVVVGVVFKLLQIPFVLNMQATEWHSTTTKQDKSFSKSL